MKRRIPLLWALVALIAGLFVATPVASGAVTRPECYYSCGGVTEDGRSAIFTFQSALSEDAVNGQIYLRANGVTSSIVHHADGSPAEQYADLLGFSNNGQHIFFQSIEQLVPADQDGDQSTSWFATPDIYEWNDGRISLVSTGPGEVNSRAALFDWNGMSADGRHVYFSTRVQLAPEDTDTCDDVYERFNGHTEFVSTGPTASPGFEGAYCDVAHYGGESADGTHVFFTSYDHLVPEDTDVELDIYQRVNGQTSLVSDFEGTMGNCSVYAGFAAASADGETVLFSTNQTLSSADTDSDSDAYVRNPNGSFELISVNTPSAYQGCGGSEASVGGDRLSTDGTRALFRTTLRLSPDDRDEAIDLYERDRRTDRTELISTGPADPQASPRTSMDYIRSGYFDASDDLRRVAFETPLPMVEADTDSEPDVYERVGGVTRLASVGPDGKSATDIAAKLISVSNDGAGIVFSTREQLVPLDTDRAVDFYVRAAETVSVPGSATAEMSLRGRRRRTRMLSIESIAPRMKVARRGAFRRGAARIRLSCPAAETSGPCRGRVRLTVGRRRAGIGRAFFKIASGRTERVRVALNQRGQRIAARGRSARVRARLRAADRVGNTRRSRHLVVIGRRSR